MQKMIIDNREDIYEYDELEKTIDIDYISEGFDVNSFMNILEVCIGFILNEFLTKGNLQKLKIDNETEIQAKHYMLQAKAYFIQKTITKKTLEIERISCWTVHHKKEKNAKKLLRLVVCFLYDEELIVESSQYAQDPELFTIFNCLYDLGNGYCKQLRLYLQKKWINNEKMPAANWRFGASGGVARPKVCADFQVSALVRAAVNLRPCLR